MRCYRIFLATFLALACLLLPKASAFPKGRPLANKTKYSRERVKLQQQTTAIIETKNDSVAPNSFQKSLILFDVLVGILYSTGFLLFPGKTLSLFFRYDFDPSIQAFLHMAVRMIAINHLGYVLGLLAAPPEKAIRVATAFLIQVIILAE